MELVIKKTDWMKEWWNANDGTASDAGSTWCQWHLKPHRRCILSTYSFYTLLDTIFVLRYSVIILNCTCLACLWLSATILNTTFQRHCEYTCPLLEEQLPRIIIGLGIPLSLDHRYYYTRLLRLVWGMVSVIDLCPGCGMFLSISQMSSSTLPYGKE